MRKKAINTMANAFEAKVQTIVQAVASAAEQLHQAATSLTKLMQQNTDKAQAVVRSADETSQNVQTVASAIEEMSASTREISQQTHLSAKAVTEAVLETDRADHTTRDLSTAVNKIGTIVTIIDDIAEQINLLSLNATIEAARAGEMGKGFAVVAGEVKSLAGQTTNATAEIARHVQSMQDVSSQVVDVLHSVKSRVDNIQHFTTTITSTAEEQSAATLEISGNMTRAAKATGTISDEVDVLQNNSVQATSAAEQVRNASQSLLSEAQRLSAEVDEFLKSVRAD